MRLWHGVWLWRLNGVSRAVRSRAWGLRYGWESSHWRLHARQCRELLAVHVRPRLLLLVWRRLAIPTAVCLIWIHVRIQVAAIRVLRAGMAVGIFRMLLACVGMHAVRGILVSLRMAV